MSLFHHISPLYVIPVVLGVICAAIYVILHNRKLKNNSDKPESSSDGKRDKSVDKLGFSKKINFKGDLKEFEEQLLRNDFGSKLTNDILLSLDKDPSTQDLKDKLISTLDNISSQNTNNENADKKPHVILFVGVNGVGKTTTLGKIAYKLKKQGKSVIISASDTYRAAAANQLEVWGERANSIVIKQNDKNKDGSSVAYEAAKKAVDENYDYLLVDTAGRMQNNKNLMDELAKIKRTIEKHTNVDEVLFVTDGTQGQTALKQAEEFSKTIDITTAVITKLDGSTKGGIIFAISDKLNVPIKFIGVGEGADELIDFNSTDFVNSLFN